MNQSSSIKRRGRPPKHPHHHVDTRAALIRSGTEVLTEQKEIMFELQKHHQKLYATQHTYENAREILMDTITLQLTEQQKKELEKPITKKELRNAIQSMDTNKAPGPDGIPVEFYDTFMLTIPYHKLSYLHILQYSLHHAIFSSHSTPHIIPVL